MTRVPKPERSARGSTKGRPIMALLDLLGRRWTLRILWELRAGRLGFRPLREACGNPSPSVLNERLRDLKEGALVDLVEGEGYGLTVMGLELATHVLPMVRWAGRWASQRARGGQG